MLRRGNDISTDSLVLWQVTRLKHILMVRNPKIGIKKRSLCRNFRVR